jgi:hypothetical protein
MQTITKRQTEPRISVNKLAEYLEAAPARRHKIVEDQKNPPTFMVTWYQDAQDAISEFILGGCTDETVLHDAITRLSRKTVKNDFEKSRNLTNVEALNSFLNSYQELETKNVTFSAAPVNPPKIEYSGVQVSVRPEILIKDNQTKEIIGCLKLYFSKEHHLNSETGAYLGAILNQYASKHLGAGANIKSKFCVAVDVLGQKIFTAPKAISRRITNVRAACEEIRLIWPTIPVKDLVSAKTTQGN